MTEMSDELVLGLALFFATLALVFSFILFRKESEGGVTKIGEVIRRI